MEGTIIMKCTCKHEQQDEMYGKGMRVHNLGGKTTKDGLYYCTVCAPRSCNKMKTDVTPMPHLGIHTMLIGCGIRKGKSAPNQQIPQKKTA